MINIRAKECAICGDVESCKYYNWTSFNGVCPEYKGKTICNKHYVQLCQYKKLLDTLPSKHEKRDYWNHVDVEILKELYSKMATMDEMTNVLNRTIGSISSKAISLGLTDTYIKPNNPKFKAEYQDYDWCFERFINRNMSHQEMADEIGATKRVIQKWCVEVHKIDTITYKHYKKLNNIQKQIIMFGLLGDGHIDKRENQPMYIESHAENQRDYLYWKYDILKDICKKEPSYKKPCRKEIRGIMCNIQGQYRLNTRIVEELKEIRGMDRSEIICKLNEFGLSLHTLDDGFRDTSNWTVCLAEYTQDEIGTYVKLCKERFNLNCHQQKYDNRYIRYDSKSSYLLDQIILKNIPNELDIIKYKITENNNIRSLSDYIYIHKEDGSKIGLRKYCSKNNLPYLKYRVCLKSIGVSDIDESKLMNLKVV